MKQIEVKETFIAQYEVKEGIISVSIPEKGSKCTQLGELPEELLARQLAKEIIRESKLNP